MDFSTDNLTASLPVGWLMTLLTDYLLVTCRLLGLIIAIPGLNCSALPRHLRFLLLFVIAAVIAPNVTSVRGSPSSPVTLAANAADSNIEPAGYTDRSPPDSVPIDEGSFDAGTQIKPLTFTMGARIGGLAVCEICMGLMLGLGANLVLQGFRMAGQMIEQHLGWAMSSTISVDGDEAGAVTGEMLFWLGGVLLFVLGGHLLLISTLLETFRTFPPGCGDWPVEPLAAMCDMMRLSLSLALQVAAPVLATQVLAGVVLSQATTAGTQFQNSGIINAGRVLLALAVLVMTLNGLSDRLLDLIPVTLQSGTPGHR